MIKIKGIKIDQFTQGFLECLLWSSTDQKDRPFDDNFSINDIEKKTLERLAADCERFQSENSGDLATERITRAGHDFWLTRNGHGAGFWDGGYEKEKGERLTAASKKFKPLDPYSHKGRVYV